MPHRPPHDLAEHIATPFVRRQDAVADQEGGRARVIAQDAGRGVEVVVHVAAVAVPGDVADDLHDGGERVDVVDGGRLLEDARQPFEARAGIDRRGRQRREPAVPVAVVLHEHQIPDFHRVVARAVDQLGDVLRQVGAAKIVNLGTGAARTGVAHRPEIVLLAEPQHAIRRSANLDPLARCFLVRRHRLVAFEHREPQTVDVEPVDVDQQFPGKADRICLKVIAERKVPEHLEKCEMACGTADVLQIVMLAAGADALLRAGGSLVRTLFPAEKDILELIHAGVREQQRRVVTGDERRARHDTMAVALEKAQERRTSLVRSHFA